MDGEDIGQHFKEVAKGSMWNLAGNVFFKVVSFFYYILVARLASQGDLGLFFIAMGVIAILDLVDDLGIAAAVIRYVPYLEGKGQSGKIRNLVLSSFIVTIIASSVLSLLVFSQAGLIASIYQKPALADALRVLSGFLILSNITKMSGAYFQGMRDMKWVQIIQNAQNTSKLIFTVAFFYFGMAALPALVGGTMASLIFSVLLGFIAAGYRVSALPKDPAPLDFRPEGIFGQAMKYGLMYVTVTAVGNALFAMDVIMLGLFGGTGGGVDSVAVYSMVNLLASALLAFPTSIGTIFVPLMARLFGAKEMDKMASITTAAQRWSLFMVIPPALVFLCFPEYLLQTIFGSSYAGGALTMIIFVLGIVVTAAYLPFSMAVSSMRLIRVDARIYPVAGLLFVLLNLALIPPLGMAGPAVSALVCAIFMLVAYRYYSGKFIKFEKSSGVPRIAAASILPLALLLVTKAAIISFAYGLPSFGAGASLGPYLNKMVLLGVMIIPGLISLAAFFSGAILLRCIRSDDVTLLAKAFKRAGVPQWLGGPLISLVSVGVRLER